MLTCHTVSYFLCPVLDNVIQSWSWHQRILNVSMYYLYILFWLRFSALHRPITTRSVGRMSLNLGYRLHKDPCRIRVTVCSDFLKYEGWCSQPCKDSYVRYEGRYLSPVTYIYEYSCRPNSTCTIEYYRIDVPTMASCKSFFSAMYIITL